MIKSKNVKYNDYSTSPKIRQILLHWGYELVESDTAEPRSLERLKK